MGNEQKKYLILSLSAIAFILIVALIIVSLSSEKKPISPKPPSTKPEGRLEKEKIKVKLFFMDGEGMVLAPEEREIFKGKNLRETINNLLYELFKGPEDESLLNPIPEGTFVREIYIVNSTCVLDLSGGISTVGSSGSNVELLTIYSIVDSIAYNFKEIKKVKIILDGMERETLFGHVYLRDPFFPDMSYVSESEQ